MAKSGCLEMLLIFIFASFFGCTLSAQCSYYSGAFLLTKYCATSCCGDEHSRTCCATVNASSSSVGMIVGAVIGCVAFFAFFVFGLACNKKFRRRRITRVSNTGVVAVTTTTTTIPNGPRVNPHTTVYPPPPPPHHNPAFPPPMYPPPPPPHSTNNNDPAYPPNQNPPPPPYQPHPPQTHPGYAAQPQAQSVHTTTTVTVI